MDRRVTHGRDAAGLRTAMPTGASRSSWPCLRRCCTRCRIRLVSDVDPEGRAHDGLEPAVAVGEDVLAGQALADLRRAGASLMVIVDARDSPQRVVPERTLVAAPPGQK